MSRSRRALRTAAIVVAVLALATAIAAWRLWRSPDGARWLATRLAPLAGFELTFAELSGPLRGPVRVRGLTLVSETLRVEVGALEFEWRARALLARRLDVERLHADRIRVMITPDPMASPETDSGLPQVRLPLAVVVRDLHVRDAVLTLDGDEMVQIETAEIVTRSEGSRVEVERLRAAGPDFAVDAVGWLEPAGDYALSLAGSWHLVLEDGATAAGQGRLWGTLEDLHLEHTLTHPLAVHTTGSIARPLREARLDAVVRVPGVVLRSLDPEWPAVEVSGNTGLVGSLDDLLIRGTATVVGLLPVAAEVGYAMHWRRPVLTVASAAVSLAGAPAEVLLEGTMTRGELPEMDLAARWRDLAWPLLDGGVFSDEGRLHLRGSPQEWRLDAAAQVTSGALGRVPVTVAAHGTLEEAVVERFTARLVPGEITAAGMLTWGEAFRWTVSAAAPDLAPSAVVPALHGTLAVGLETTGTFQDGQIRATMDPVRVTGVLAGQQFTAGAAVSLAGEVVTLDTLEAVWGGVRMTAGGTLGDRLALRAALSAPDLAEADIDVAGTATAALVLEGPVASPRLDFTAAATDLVTPRGTVQRLEMSAQGDFSLPGSVSARLVAAGLVLGGRALEEVVANLEGSLAHHRAALTITGQGGRAQVDLAGAVVGPTWTGAATRLDLEWPEWGDWALVQPATVHAGPAAVEVGPVQLTHGDGRLQAVGSWRRESGWHGSLDLADLPLGLLSSWLPAGTTVAGACSGAAEVAADSGGRLTARLHLGAGPVTLGRIDGSGDHAFTVDAFTLTATAGEEGARVETRATVAGIGTVAGWIALPDWIPVTAVPSASETLAGHLELDVADLAVVRTFTLAVTEPGGRVAADLVLGGTVGAPEMRGTAALTGGRARLGAAGITVQEAELTVTTTGTRMEVAGRARSGKGQLTVTGGGPLPPSTHDPVRLLLEGERFLAADRREARVEVSPRLELAVSPDRLALTGDVTVPWARIEIKETPAGTVMPSPDTVLLGGDGVVATVEPAFAVTSRVRLTLGADITVAALGLSGRPRGSVLLVDEPGRPTTATGTVELLDGTFKAYGQDLTVERGRLIFAGGPLSNPGLDLRAFRRANDGTVAGVTVSGSARDPRVDLWSEPPMNQSDQLAYLLLGRPLAGVGDGDVVSLDDAALLAGLKGGDLLARRLGAGLGLEEARIETGRTVEDASLVLGTYLSPRLYIAYGVGLFQPVNTFRLRYLLGRRWILQAEGSGAGSGADLLYSVESGRGAPDTPRPFRP